MSYVLEVKFLYGRVIILCHWVIKADGFNEQQPWMWNVRGPFRKAKGSLRLCWLVLRFIGRPQSPVLVGLLPDFCKQLIQAGLPIVGYWGTWHPENLMRNKQVLEVRAV